VTSLDYTMDRAAVVAWSQGGQAGIRMPVGWEWQDPARAWPVHALGRTPR
jgi:hypothetical protein